MEYKEISDLGLISALRSKGYEQTDVLQQGSRIVFTFEWDDNMRDLEEQYFSNNLMVDALNYSRELRNVKGIIYSIKEGRAR